MGVPWCPIKRGLRDLGGQKFKWEEITQCWLCGWSTVPNEQIGWHFRNPYSPFVVFSSPEKKREENIWNNVHFGAVSKVLEIEVNGAKQAHQNVAFLPHIFCSQKISGRKCDVNKTHTRLTRQRCWFFHIFQYLRDLMLKLFVYLPFSSPPVYISSTPVWFTRLYFSSQPIWHVEIVFFPV